MKDVCAQCHRYERYINRFILDWTKAEIQVQHNIENVAANESNLEAKIEKKKVSEEHWSPEGDLAVKFKFLQKI